MRFISSVLVPTTVLLVVVGAVATPVYADNLLQWTWQRPIPQGNTLNAVDYGDAMTIYAVGEVGTVIKSIDGGNSWSLLDVGPNEEWTDVYFHDAMSGIIVGLDGTILRTTDGGVSWESQLLFPLVAVDFFDIATGAVAGPDGVFRTVDGGDTWQQVRTGDCIDVATPTALKIFTVVDEFRERAYQTFDGGDTWSSSFYDWWADAPNLKPGVCFSDSLRGMVVGLADGGYCGYTRYCKVEWTTVDGGVSWQGNLLGESEALIHDIDCRGLTAVTATRLTIPESNWYRLGYVSITQDWGQSHSGFADWNVLSFEGVAVYDQSVSIAVGPGGLLERTTDGWSTALSNSPGRGLNDIAFWDPDVGVAVGSQKMILTTADGGATWNSVALSSPEWLSVDVRVLPGYELAIAGGQNGWVAWSDDHWNTWTEQRINGVSRVHGVALSDDALTAIALGNGRVYYTNNGINYFVMNHPLPGVANAVAFGKNLNQDIAVVVGSAGAIALSYDGGQTWTTNNLGTEDIVDVAFSRTPTLAAFGAAVSRSGTIWWTSNGGILWGSDYNLGTTDNFVSVAVGGVSPAGLAAAVLTESGDVYVTMDWGTSWSRDVSGSGMNSLAMSGATTPTVHVASSLGGIMVGKVDETTPTYINAFDAQPRPGRVELSWQIESDDVVDGFRLQRTEGEGRLVDLAGNGLLMASARSFVDDNVSAGTEYTYRLIVLLDDGQEVLSQFASAKTPAAVFELGQNRPNPFNPTTQIRYSVGASGTVRITVFDTAGRRIRTLVDDERDAGWHSVTWNGHDDAGGKVASGVYFYRLEAGGHTQTRKLLLLK